MRVVRNGNGKYLGLIGGAALVVAGSSAIIAHVGDTRLYRLRGGRLCCLTTDHTFATELVRAGTCTEARALESPYARLLTRAVGSEKPLDVDLEIFDAEPGDRFVLCTDGLDKEVHPEEIARVATHGGLASTAADALVELAVSRGSRDNVTAVVVEVVDGYTQRPDEDLTSDDEDTIPDYHGSAYR